MNHAFRCAQGLAVVSAIGLSGCGGGSPSETTSDPSTPSAGKGELRQALSITATGASLAGTWTAPFNLGVIAVHMALQPDGRVLFYGTRPSGEQTGYNEVGVFDPQASGGAGEATLYPNGSLTDIFCSSQTVLPLDGRTFISGGDQLGPGNDANNNTTLFDYRSNSVSRGSNLNRARWYSSTTTLMNGEIYVQGGAGGYDRPEVRQVDGSMRLLSTADTSGLGQSFPRNWVAPDGRVFGIDEGGNLYYVDTAGTGTLTAVGQMPAAHSGIGAAGAAMFRPGRILTLSNSSTAAAVVDIRRGAPAVSTTEAGSATRVWGVATVMADGRVLATGGSTANNDLNTAAYTADAWNPVTGEWTVGARYGNARLYHGTALLLPDARVLLAGGGSPGPLTNTNGELYSPSYLYGANGQLASRPTLTSAPTVVEPGQVFTLSTAAPGVSRITFVRLGSVSHSWSSDQRLLDLPFSANGTQITAMLPSQATDTPPGFYMVYAFDAQGVPSVARILRVNLPGARPAATAPVMADIADRASALTTVRLTPSAQSPRGAALRYTASGLPPGLSIAPTTGTITGTPTQRGTYFVSVSADDGAWTASRSFVWAVGINNTAPKAQPVPAANAGAALNFTATATGAGLQYTWNFGDGSATTARSASSAARHVYTQAGVYTVTVTTYDSQGLPATATFLQTVALPTSAGKPSRSSPMALDATRLWIVNPDSNTVAVFDTASQARLAEIAVGTHPVALAMAADGRVWVSNQGSDTVSIIEPASMSVVRTLTLAPGSSPWGLVAVGSRMHVVLEGPGLLQRYDSSSFSLTGSVAVGANVRHVAARADGSALYVSRFITPPVPGESTAAVNTAGAGGVVTKVDMAGFTLSRQILLAHSERVDSENQGRGLPNYLGAMALSPDGTQAYVPGKQDNIRRGVLRDGRNLDFQNTVRAISSRVLLASDTEDLAHRVDHDNASLASAAAFDPTGVYLFVALETSREVAVVNAHNQQQVMRVITGFAPQSVEVSSDGKRLYVGNFMDRSVDIFDLSLLMQKGLPSMPHVATWFTTSAEKLPPQVLRGKRLFYDARDTRLARDRYMSCASCHSDGGHDGRVWDLTGFGEGLRNTISLRGRAGMGQGRLHWSGNFDEVQDFESQIRALAGGTGLLPNAAPNPPLGEPNAGRNADLDALADYVGSLSRAQRSPWRPANGVLDATALAGAQVYAARCVQCHGGSGGSSSQLDSLHNVGTLLPSSGKRLSGLLGGIDVPGLREVALTAPYLHDGSAATVEDAVQRHNASLSPAEVASVAAFLRQAELDRDVPLTRLAAAPDVFVAGSAQWLPDGRVQLTPASNGAAGALWASQRWATTQSFATEFDLSLQGPQTQALQADGLAFVLQSGAGGVGAAGGGQGWAGLPGAVAARLSTWTHNRAGIATETRQAIPAGVDLGAAKSITGRMKVRWDAAQRLLSMEADLILDGVPRQLRDSAVVDLQALYGPTVRAGITGATGGALADQSVSNWTVRFGSTVHAADAQLLGSAVQRTAGDVLLTPDRMSQAGAWSTRTPWRTDVGFETRFNFRMARGASARMADGLSIALHTGGPSALGGAGGCQGSCDLPQVVRAGILGWTYNVGGLELAGVKGYTALGFDLGAAQVVTGTMTLRYDPVVKRLNLRADLWADGVPLVMQDSVAVDLQARFGSSFTASLTAATGGGTATHSVSDWSVEFASPPVLTALDGLLVAAPSCVESNAATGRIDCVGLGTGNDLWTRRREGGTWIGGWQPWGGSFVANEAPSCTSAGGSAAQCFLRGRDGALWSASTTGAGWTLANMGGILTEAVSCTSSQPNRVLCMVRGTDNAAYTRYYNGSGWTGWARVASTLASAPECTSSVDGQYNCVWRGVNGDLQHLWLPNGVAAEAPYSLGGAIVGKPSCTRVGAALNCYARGTENGLWQRTWDGSAWRPWTLVAGSSGLLGAAPACTAARLGGATQCTVVSADGRLRSVSAPGAGLAGSAALRWLDLAGSSWVEAPGCLQGGNASVQALCAYRRTDLTPFALDWQLPQR